MELFIRLKTLIFLHKTKFIISFFFFFSKLVIMSFRMLLIFFFVVNLSQDPKTTISISFIAKHIIVDFLSFVYNWLLELKWLCLFACFWVYPIYSKSWTHNLHFFLSNREIIEFLNFFCVYLVVRVSSSWRQILNLLFFSVCWIVSCFFLLWFMNSWVFF